MAQLSAWTVSPSRLIEGAILFVQRLHVQWGAPGLIAFVLVGAALAYLLGIRRRRGAEPVPVPYRPGVLHQPLGEEPAGVERSRNFELLVNASGEGLLLTDLTGRTLLSNRLFRELFPGPDVARVIEAGSPFLSGLKEGQQLLSRMVGAFASPESQDEGIATTARGQSIVWRTMPACDAKGAVIGRIFAVREQTAEREVESLKTEFVSAVSHELRTPLTSVKGSLELVLSRDDLPSGDRELLEISLKNTERLIRLINDILDMSKLEFELENLDLAPTLREAAESVQPLAERLGIRIEVQVPVNLSLVHADRHRVHQVVANLLSNAIKFSTAGATVALRARPVGGGVEVEVQDWGVGVPLDQQQHLFKRFRRIRNPAAPDVSGTGLGLSISKAIVERLGGWITATSVPGRGSIFTFRLPPSIYRPQEEAPRDPAADAQVADGAAVLLIEDDQDLRHVLGTALTAGGFRVEATGAGVDGVKIARTRRPAAIVLDLLLPDLSGYDLLRILNNSPDTRDIPVILVSVQPERGLAIRLGAADVLVKPVDGAELLYAVRRAVLRQGDQAGRLRVLAGCPASREVSVAAAALTKRGHEVLRARDDHELVAAAQEHYPDLILLDEDFVGTPGASDTLLTSLRERPISRRIPIVVLCSGAAPAPRSDLFLAVKKPVNVDSFVRQVEQILKVRERPQLTLASNLVSTGS